MISFFAVYSGLPKARGHACIARAADPTGALKAARSNGIAISRSAYARRVTIQEYADILRGCGLTVSGVPDQMQLMEASQ